MGKEKGLKATKKCMVHVLLTCTVEAKHQTYTKLLIKQKFSS